MLEILEPLAMMILRNRPRPGLTMSPMTKDSRAAISAFSRDFVMISIVPR